MRGAAICATLLAGCGAPVDRHHDCDSWPLSISVPDDGWRDGDCARDDRLAVRRQVAEREQDQPEQPETVDHDDPGHDPAGDTAEDRGRHHPETEREEDGHDQE